MKIIFFLFLIFSTAVSAEYIEPGEVDLTTEKYPASTSNLKPVKYIYAINWQGVPVGTASVQVDDTHLNPQNSEPLIGIKAEAQSAKVIDVFYKLRHTSESFVSKKDFHPVKFKTWQTENSKKKSAEVVFERDGRISSSVQKDGKEEKKNDFVSNNFTLDPISAAFFARSIEIKVGQKSSFDVFNGKHRYLIEFDVVSLEEIEVMGLKRQAFKAVPKVTKLTDTEGEQRLSEAAIWIADDNTRDILKLESKVFVGSVGATLVKVDSQDHDVEKVKLALTEKD